MEKYTTKISRSLDRLVRRKSIDNALPLILNEAVNFETQTIFIAVPKTGTTSVRAQLRPKGKQLIDAPHLNITQIRDSLYFYFLKLSTKRNIAFPTDLDSVSTDAEIREQAAQVFRNFFKFSAVRNPWARAVSLYYRREGISISDEISFEDFCKQHIYASDTCLFPTLHQNQYDWLCDETEGCVMDYVYKVEEFDTAIKEIADLTNGRIQLDDQTLNYNPKSQSRSYQNLYTEETKRIIAKRFEKDIDTFKYTF